MSLLSVEEIFSFKNISKLEILNTASILVNVYVGSIVLVINLVMLTIRGNGCVKVSNSHFHIVVATHSCDTCCVLLTC